MKANILIITTLLIALFVNCNSVLAKDITTETRKLESFDKIICNIPAFISIVQGNESKIEIKSDDKTVKKVITKVKDEELSIEAYDFKIKNLTLIIYTPNCYEITNYSMGDVEFCFCSISFDNLSINNRSFGDISVNKIVADSIAINNENVGDVKVESISTKHFTTRNIGIGDINIKKNNATELIINNDGIGDVIIKGIGTKQLTATNNGVGDIKLVGIAENINLENNGIGDINADVATENWISCKNKSKK